MASDFLILTEKEIRASIGLDAEALAAVEDGFARMARGEAEVPPPMGIPVLERDGEVHVKSAYLHGLPGFAVKIATGFWRNTEQGLPASSGLMVLLDAVTGFPLALLLDNGYLTDIRTALAGAVAAKHLARKEIHTVGVIGTGVQARLQVEALRLVRSFERVLVWGRHPDSAQRYAEEMKTKLGVAVSAVAKAVGAVQQSEVVITATPSRQALVAAADLHPGLHVSAMGSDGPGKQELDPQVPARADLLVCDRASQCAQLGELQHALAAGLLTLDSPISELGEIVAGRKPGRTSDQQITVFDSTGVGVQDTAIATLAYRRARQRNLGHPFSSE